MGKIDEILAWWNEHHTWRKGLVGAVTALLSLVVLMQGDILAKVPPEYLAIATAFFGLLAAILNYLKHNTTLPVVGTKAPGKKRIR